MMHKDPRLFLENFVKTSHTEAERIDAAIQLASLIFSEAEMYQTKQEKKRNHLFSLIMQDEKAKIFLTRLFDTSFRSKKPRAIMQNLHSHLHGISLPLFLPIWQKLAIKLLGFVGQLFPQLATSLLISQIRKETKEVILPGEKEELNKHLLLRKKQGIRVNLNRLGEAILGEEAAEKKILLIQEDLENPLVETVSVKISNIFSQINLVDFEGSLFVLKARLRCLLRACKKHTPYKFLCLDMEEFRDLELTATLFQEVLNEDEFLDLSAGIALQSYLPDSFAIQQKLTLWAKKRLQKQGAPIYIRIVKGANLGMERVDASIKCFNVAPYSTKKQTDANFKRMCHFGMYKEHLEGCHIAIASHNLFDVCYFLLLRHEKKISQYVHFEMLEGMATHIQKSLNNILQAYNDSLLLYCPASKKEEFHTSIAYLMRRLDEQTDQDNFLPHIYSLEHKKEEFKKQADIFRQSFSIFLDNTTHRTQNRQSEIHEPLLEFKNEPDTDFSRLQNRKWADEIYRTWPQKQFEIPLFISNEWRTSQKIEEGIDPSRPGFCLHRYYIASKDDLENALLSSRNSLWYKVPKKEKASFFKTVALRLREKRAHFIGAMIAESAKPFLEADSEVSEAIDMAEYYAHTLTNRTPTFEHSKSSIHAIISPWNFPLAIPLSGILASLASGSSVIFKPAQEAILTGWMLTSLLLEAGIDKNTLQFIACKDDPEGSYLIQHPLIDAVVLTGATATAKHFLHMRPTLRLFAETGGKNSLIVSRMADRDLAIRDTVQSAFSYSGQKCSALSLLILEEEVYHDTHFLHALEDAVRSLKAGSVWSKNTKVGPLIRTPNSTLLKAMTTLEQGESWLVKPEQDLLNPKLWTPGVKLGVTQGVTSNTEFFGPLLGVAKAKNFTEAIQFANSTPYGLTAGLHSLKPEEQSEWLSQIEAGNCYINRGITGAIVGRQPFGGTKASSFGIGQKAGGEAYITQLAPPACFLHDELTYEKTKELYFPEKEELISCVGQSNMLYSQAHKKIYVYIEEHDRLEHVQEIVYITKLLHIELILCCPFAIEGVKRYGKEEFTSLIQKEHFARIRTLSEPPQSLLDSWKKSMASLDIGPPSPSKKAELTRFIRQVSLSFDYHRYGNIHNNRYVE